MSFRHKPANVENLAYKFRIYPDEEQIIKLAKTFGCCRWLWNRMLTDRKDLYNIMGITVNNSPADYKDLEECNWLNEVDSLALANVQLNLDSAYKNFFEKTAGYPVLKKKQTKQSYTTNVSNKKNPNVKLMEEEGLLKIPKMSPIHIVIHRKIKDGGELKSVTISKDTDGRYYASLLFEYQKTDILKSIDKRTSIDEKKAIGLDMGLQGLYVDSNNQSAEMPKFYRDAQTKIAKEQAILSCMKQGSNNYKKQKQKIAKLHAKIKRQRIDFLYKQTHALLRNCDIICIEDLDLKEMARQDNHGKAVYDIGWGIFVRILEWLCKKLGKRLIKVNRFFASSQICHVCGYKQKMNDLSNRTYKCPECGTVIDRDYNAALNIRDEGLRLYRTEMC